MRAVIFDMDGVIVDSEPLWREAEMEVFAGVGLDLSEADCERTMGMRPLLRSRDRSRLVVEHGADRRSARQARSRRHFLGGLFSYS